MAIHVQELEEKHAQAWDAFVLEHAHGSPFHLLAWKRSIEETFGYASKYLIALDGSGVRGVLPLFVVRNLQLRKILVSSPFAVYGGILADSEEVKAAFSHSLKQLAKSLGVDYVELRNAHPEQCAGFPRLSRYVTFTHPIAADEDAILKSFLPKTRTMVRKGMKNFLTSRVQSNDVQRFHWLYSANLKRLGTPRFPLRHFDSLLRNFRGQVEIREVLHRDEVVAAGLSFYFRDQVLPYYAASDWQKNHLAPNNFLYFDLMRSSAAAGIRVFDFGRSRRPSGSYEFKKHWGMTERELPYEILPAGVRTLPDYTPGNPRLKIGIKIWQQLPEPLTDMIGPRLIRYLP